MLSGSLPPSVPPTDGTAPPHAAPSTWLAASGRMGELVQNMDWSRTPLGPIEGWPQSLRTTVSLCLASNFPISITWGPHHVQIYNDGYWPICGDMHPHSMGQGFIECWASAWPVIGDSFARALAGSTSFLEDQRMFVDRNGFLEETFFTFSFSPIRDESGGVGGLFHPVTETTSKKLSERRARALRDLNARMAKVQTVDEALAVAMNTIAEHPFDIPYALLYRLDAQDARLVQATGVATDSPLRAAAVEGTDGVADSCWPLDLVLRGEPLLLDDLDVRFAGAPAGPYDEPPTQALLLPLTPPGAARPLAALVLGISPRLPITDFYRTFLDLIPVTIALGIATVLAAEEKRRRAEALAEIDRAKTTFFSNISHEFRTPLTLMLGPLEDILLRPDLAADLRTQLDLVQRNGLRLLKLVNVLLDFSRIEAGRTTATFAPLDLARLTVDLVSSFRSLTDKAGLHLTVDTPPLPQAVHLDRDLCERILLNLLSNAVKFTLTGGITVRLTATAHHAQLTVSDTGIGIPAAELPRMFERFHRIEGTAGRSHEGSGIGLALVQELTELQGGTVTVDSVLGRGTTFTVAFPFGTGHLDPQRLTRTPSGESNAVRVAAYVNEALYWLPEDEPDARPCGLAGTAPHTPSGTPPPANHPAAVPAQPVDRPRLVLADDNHDMRQYLRSLLAVEYDVVVVADGQEALEAIRQRPPDLVLSDVMMPRMDGVTLLRVLRSDPRTREIPVVLLSARAGEEALVEGISTGADDYLIKPFSARELLARVKTHLRMGRLRLAWAHERESNNDLTDSNRLLTRANRELESFSYSVSHDLRTPLRAIDGFSRLLDNDALGKKTPEERDYLRRIRSASQRMGNIIDDLLGLSRIGRTPLRRERVDVTALARAIVGRLAEQAPGRVVQVTIADHLVTHADPGLTETLLANLLENAWKYTSRQAAASITVDACVEEGSQVFRISDNGAGFDMAEAKKLFSPFQRLHDASDFSGTGIGLATVQRIATCHGGRVWAKAEKNLGANFFFTFGNEP